MDSKLESILPPEWRDEADAHDRAKQARAARRARNLADKRSVRS